MKSNRGFSLVELLTVVVITGVSSLFIAQTITQSERDVRRLKQTLAKMELRKRYTLLFAERGFCSDVFHGGTDTNIPQGVANIYTDLATIINEQNYEATLDSYGSNNGTQLAHSVEGIIFSSGQRFDDFFTFKRAWLQDNDNGDGELEFKLAFSTAGLKRDTVITVPLFVDSEADPSSCSSTTELNQLTSLALRAPGNNLDKPLMETLGWTDTNGNGLVEDNETSLGSDVLVIRDRNGQEILQIIVPPNGDAPSLIFGMPDGPGVAKSFIDFTGASFNCAGNCFGE